MSLGFGFKLSKMNHWHRNVLTSQFEKCTDIIVWKMYWYHSLILQLSVRLQCVISMNHWHRNVLTSQFEKCTDITVWFYSCQYVCSASFQWTTDTEMYWHHRLILQLPVRLQCVISMKHWHRHVLTSQIDFTVASTSAVRPCRDACIFKMWLIFVQIVTTSTSLLDGRSGVQT